MAAPRGRSKVKKVKVRKGKVAKKSGTKRAGKSSPKKKVTVSAAPAPTAAQGIKRKRSDSKATKAKDTGKVNAGRVTRVQASGTRSAESTSPDNPRPPPKKRMRKSPNRLDSLPYRSPTPPRSRSPSYPPYGGLEPRDDEGRPKSANASDGKEIGSVVSKPDDPISISGPTDSVTVGRSKDRRRSRIASVSPDPPRSILKSRSTSYPPPRQRGRRTKRKIRFSRVVRKRSISPRKKRRSRSRGKTAKNKKR